MLRGHAQLLFHMNGGSGDKGVNTPRDGRRNGLSCRANVFFLGTRQTAHGTVFHHRGYGFNRLKVPWTGRWKTRFNDIHAQTFQLTTDTNFFITGHGCTGALFAIAHGGIKYDQFFRHDRLQKQLINPLFPNESGRQGMDTGIRGF